MLTDAEIIDHAWQEIGGGGSLITTIVFRDGSCIVVGYGVVCRYRAVDDYWRENNDLEELPLSGVEITYGGRPNAAS